MDARELAEKWEGGAHGTAYWSADECKTLIRALRLLAAAEANDGTNPETDACADWNARCERVGDNEVITHGLMLALAHDESDELRLLSKRLERERNGLAAMVGELENECSAADIYGRTSASHGFINAPKWNELADETKSLYRESAARSKP